MIRLAALLVLIAATAPAATKTGRYHNRDAWTVDTPTLRVSILQWGGHIAEIALKEPGTLNPLWVQKRPTIDPYQYDAKLHEKYYGGGSGARLISGIAGHNLCFPFWGDPTEAEFKAGMTYHGETAIVQWRLSTAADDGLTVIADMPESGTRFIRKVKVAGQVAYFVSTGENRTAWDKAVGWCEHATIAAPFLEKGVTQIEASLTRGRNLGDESGKEFAWPTGFDGEARIDLRTVRNIEKSGFVNNFLIDPKREIAFFSAYHPRLRQVFGYVFRRAEFPWLNIWEANEPAMLTRGLEFSNTPTHGTLKAMVQAKPIFNTPMYEWIDARSGITKRFAAFSARVPEGYQGVADVRVSGAKLELVELKTGKVQALDFDGGFFK
jgi:hypothetical protein